MIVSQETPRIRNRVSKVVKNYLRKITVSGKSYLWYRVHRHVKAEGVSPCVETLSVFAQASKKNPLRMRFWQRDNRVRVGRSDSWEVGYPEDGVVWLRDQNRNCIFRLNLNRPKVVATLIRLVQATGWNPNDASPPLIIENGLQFLDLHFSELREAIDPDRLDAIPDPANFDVQTGGIYRSEGRQVSYPLHLKQTHLLFPIFVRFSFRAGQRFREQSLEVIAYRRFQTLGELEQFRLVILDVFVVVVVGG